MPKLRTQKIASADTSPRLLIPKGIKGTETKLFDRMPGMSRNEGTVSHSQVDIQNHYSQLSPQNVIQSARIDVAQSTTKSSTHLKLKSLYPKREAPLASVEDIVSTSLRKHEFGVPGYTIGAISHKQLLQPTGPKPGKQIRKPFTDQAADHHKSVPGP